MDGFRSTVLRPSQEEGSKGPLVGEEQRGHRGQLHDILNQNVATGPLPSSSEPPRPQSSSFNLRSPPRHSHPPPFPVSPSSTINGTYPPPPARSILNNPFLSPSATTSALPSSLAAPPIALASAAPSSSIGSSGLQPPSLSPLPPPTAYYSSEVRPDREITREKPTAGGYYDPTKDTSKESRVSDNGWHNTTQTSTPKVRSLSINFLAPLPHSLFLVSHCSFHTRPQIA